MKPKHVAVWIWIRIPFSPFALAYWMWINLVALSDLEPCPMGKSLIGDFYQLDGN
jgi:hypothetical protein